MERLGQLGLVERLSGDTVVETVEERIKEQVTLKKNFFWKSSVEHVGTPHIRFKLAGDHLTAVTWRPCNPGWTGEHNNSNLQLKEKSTSLEIY